MNKFLKPNCRGIFLIWLSIALFTSCAVGNPTLTPTRTTWNEKGLQQVVENWRIRSNIPGVVVGLSLPVHSEIIIASGQSDLKNHIAIEPGDQFQIASITKTFIAAEILLLASEEKLSLDDPLNMYLTEIPHGDLVTIRYLMSHRSGYFDPIHDDPAFISSLSEELEKQWTWNEMLEIAFQHDLFFEPGSDYQYSNTNYLLLALVIEKITQTSLEQVLTSMFLSPLQLEHTRYRTVEMNVNQTDLVHGYATHPVTGEIVDTMSIPYTAILSVSTDTMISNASDLLKWSRILYGHSSTLLAPAFREQMLTFDSISPYGLGVFRFDTPFGVSFGHGGDTAGYLARMEYFPGQDMSMVILVNADAPTINLSGLRDELLATLFGIDQNTAIKELIAELKSENSSTRKDAIIALGHSKPGSEDVITALIEVLKQDPSAENRKEAALALGFVGQNSNKVMQALNDAMRDEDDSVRGAAAIALSVLE